jgi:hypothetical protein
MRLLLLPQKKVLTPRRSHVLTAAELCLEQLTAVDGDCLRRSTGIDDHERLGNRRREKVLGHLFVSFF